MFRVNNKKLESSSNILVLRAFAYQVFVSFVNRGMFYTVNVGFSANFHKIIQKTVVTEYFLRNVADLQPKTL